MSYRTMYATAGLGQTMYAAAGLGQTMYATAGLGSKASSGASSGASLPKAIRLVQQALIDKGFSVGATGADGAWGRNSRAGYDRALGAGSSAQTRVDGSNLILPEAHWHRLMSMPNRQAPVTPPSGGGASPSGGGSSPAAADPTLLEPIDAGTDWMSYWPYAAGGAAVLGLGGFFIWKGRKARMQKNKRRRRRSSRGRRR